MAANYSRPAFSPVPKDPPKLLVSQAKKATTATTDKKERAACHERSGGQCEVREYRLLDGRTARQPRRCVRRASENHHLIGGSGRRNRGRSILSKHRIDVCARCHADITGKVLVPHDGIKAEDAATVTYDRIVLPAKKAIGQ